MRIQENAKASMRGLDYLSQASQSIEQRALTSATNSTKNTNHVMGDARKVNPLPPLRYYLMHYANYNNHPNAAAAVRHHPQQHSPQQLRNPFGGRTAAACTTEC